jgi:hypothetical protein
MKSVVAVIFCLGISLSAIAQTESSGTIVYVSWSQNEIAIAADSRQSGAHSYWDTGCKIAAFGNKLIFAMTGRSSPGVDPSWDAYAVASKQFDRITRERTADHLANRLADAWGEDVKAEFERLGDMALGGLDDNHVAIGIFADFEQDGTLLIVVSDVTYEKRLVHSKISVQTEIIPPNSGNGYFLGHAEVVSEINAANTPHGIEWHNELRDRVRAKADEVAEEAIGFVDLTIQNLPKTKTDIDGIPFSVVGPPIAAVRLVRGKGIDWVAKGKCIP